MKRKSIAALLLGTAVATIPANEAFTPLDKSTCPLLKK